MEGKRIECNLWNLHKNDPYNPHILTELVRVAEDSKNFDGIVEAYNTILNTYPLLHIYWNKLALLIKSKTTSAREAISTFAKAVSHEALYYSVDMWHFYCDFVKTYSAEFTEGDIREVFEKAIDAVGTFYTSDIIWSLYINWEEERGDSKHVSQLFPRVLSQPIRNLEQFWQSFLKHCETHNMEDVVSPEEHNIVEQIISEMAERDELPTSESINEERKRQTYNIRVKRYSEAIEKINTFVMYELKLHRTYFHFVLPDEIQMANWFQYLESEENNFDYEATTKLYERCLIPCNLSAEVWIRYARYIQKISPEQAPAILERAAKGALGSDPNFRRLQGLFLESIGDTESAAAIFENMRNIKTAEAVIAVAQYLLRCREDPAPMLADFLEDCHCPDDYAAVAAMLHRLGAPVDPVKLLERAPDSILALGVSVSIFEENNDYESVKTAFQSFSKSKAPIKDKIDAATQLGDILGRSGAPVAEVRQNQRQIIDLERQQRQEIRNERLEAAKRTDGTNDVLDMWVNYLKEYDLHKESHQTNATEETDN